MVVLLDVAQLDIAVKGTTGPTRWTENVVMVDREQRKMMKKWLEPGAQNLPTTEASQSANRMFQFDHGRF